MCYYILDRDINSRISIIGRFGRKTKSMERQFTLPYLTSVPLPPWKENHTVSYVKRVLGGGVLCEWKSHHLRIHEYNLYTLKIRLIHTGYTSLSNQVKTIHNDCPDITYKICMLHVLEKFKKTHHCLKSKSLCSYG